jgi:hypothetical protein
MSTRTKPWSRRRGAMDPPHKVQPKSGEYVPMAEPRARETQCTRKKVCGSVESAWATAHRIMQENPGANVRPYRCPFCLGIHVGRFDVL